MATHSLHKQVMMTSSNGNIFRVTGRLCDEFAGHRWIPRTQRPMTQSFDLRLNKRLSKQSRGWWFETPSCPLWRRCNDGSYLMRPPFQGHDLHHLVQSSLARRVDNTFREGDCWTDTWNLYDWTTLFAINHTLGNYLYRNRFSRGVKYISTYCPWGI